jgi:hypothetical protein
MGGTLKIGNTPLNHGLAEPCLQAVTMISMAGDDIIDCAPSLGLIVDM